ncbi:MAG: PEGA domain-containing protein [Sandaracinaceae bacterium]|nr:PEGA domain-containing protein [Sandaracinaceae bacterium]
MSRRAVSTRLAGGLSLLLAWLAPWAARAQSAEELLAEGLALRAQQDDEGALALFERAAALEPSTRVDAQVALALQALGRWLEADARLTALLARDEDEWLARNRPHLVEALAEVGGRLGELVIECAVDGARVLVDRREVGTTPLPGPVRAVAGTAIVEVLADGHHAIQRRVLVAPRERARERFEPVPLAAEALEAPPARGRSAPGTASAEPAPWLVLGASGAVAGAVFLGLGGAAFAVREDQIAVWNDDARCDRLEGPSRDEECPGPAGAWRAAEGLAIAGFVVGGAIGLAGLVALVVAALSPAAPARACAPTLDGVACRF